MKKISLLLFNYSPRSHYRIPRLSHKLPELLGCKEDLGLGKGLSVHLELVGQLIRVRCDFVELRKHHEAGQACIYLRCVCLGIQRPNPYMRTTPGSCPREQQKH
jgi:hypothetical protein